ncbi:MULTISPECIES: MipA/OmpV family protein [Hydrogenophaga]|uniref:MipA/OmpV family protein n=1 Tax=Hydrogenophaga TaxID=47420 RepID=UPI001F0FAC72|nr:MULTISPECIES: MipA/OmpV family protein [Hydrogenophaga]
MSGHQSAAAAGLTGLALCTALAATPALAQEAEIPRGESRWGIGLGADVRQQPYRGVDNASTGIPLVYFENHWVRVMGPSAELKLPSAGPFAFRLKARYSDEGYKPSDSAALAGMAEREDGIWLGGEVIWQTPYLNLSAELMGDASSHSEGRQFRLQADRRFDFGAFSVTPRLAAIRLDREYVGYYHGVGAAEATAGRPAYGGEAATNVEAGLRVDYRLDAKQTVFLDLRSTRLGSAIADSPLVDRSRVSGVRVGYFYRF